MVATYFCFCSGETLQKRQKSWQDLQGREVLQARVTHWNSERTERTNGTTAQMFVWPLFSCVPGALANLHRILNGLAVVAWIWGTWFPGWTVNGWGDEWIPEAGEWIAIYANDSPLQKIVNDWLNGRKWLVVTDIQNGSWNMDAGRGKQERNEP